VRVTGPQALGSRYVLEDRIGSGGMGAVWRGTDRGNGLPVAVKLLHEQFATDPAVLTRFVRERTVLVGLRHPNLVPVHDMIMEGDRLALIMELVQGADLHHHLSTRGPLPPALAATLIAQVCDALALVHAAGVIHRDLKPSNILLDMSRPAPIARLTDFGIAWADDAMSLTSDGAVVGTPAYFAPEVVTGQRGGPAADVYAAGTSLFELLAGRPPFAGGPTAAVIWRHLDAEPLCPPAIPEPLWQVIAACLAKDPAQRPDAATAARWLYNCLPALRGLPAAAPLPADVATFAMSERAARREPTGTVTSLHEPPPAPVAPVAPVSPAHARPASPRRRRRGRVVLLTAGLLVTAAGVAAFTLSGGASPPPAARPAGPAPVGSWRLDSTHGTVASDATGANPGTAFNVLWGAGRGGWGDFNGTDSQIVTAGPVLNTGPGASFTVAAWVYLTKYAVNVTAVSQDSTGDSAFCLQYYSGGTGWGFTRYAANSVTPSPVSAQSTSPAVLNTWVHLVGVYDADDGQLRLYVNGKPQGTATDTTPYASHGSLAIGRAQFGAQDIDWFPGRINDVEVFQQALTPTEVKAL
jgi:Protein kinase domain/Concanavalin A-like lectin/glucanases superfamily